MKKIHVFVIQNSTQNHRMKLSEGSHTLNSQFICILNNNNNMMNSEIKKQYVASTNLFISTHVHFQYVQYTKTFASHHFFV